MSEKQQVSVFRIALEEVQEIITHTTGEVECTPDTIINFITGFIPASRKPTELEFRPTIIEHFKPYSIRAFFGTKPIDFGWSDFFRPILTGAEANKTLLDARRTVHKLFFAFICSNESIYLFSGGLGYHDIKNFLDDDFGISILQRLDLGEELQLMMLKSRSIVGNVAVDQRIFRNVHTILDEYNLGKVYGDVAAKLPFASSPKDLKKMLFGKKADGAKNIHAGQSFKFAKAISFTDLKSIVTFFDETLAKDSKFVLSSLKPIKKDKQYHKQLIKKLDAYAAIALYDALEAIISGTKATVPFFEITNSKFHDFYQCDKITLRRRGIELNVYDSPYGILAENLICDIAKHDLDHIRQKITEINRQRSQEKIDLLKAELISTYYLQCENSEQKKVPINRPMTEFISGEVEQAGTPYFILDAKWYKSEENFVSKLDQEFSDIHLANSYSYPFKKWGKFTKDGKDRKNENENSYLHDLVKSQPKKTLVMHRLIKNQFELCDLLTWDDENLYILHVKPSFDGNVRVLTQQISHSSRLIEEDLRKGFDQANNLKDYYSSATDYTGNSDYFKLVKRQFKGMSDKDFFELFKKRRSYVACIVDTNGRDLSAIEEFNSNIAKMSLIEGYRAIRSSVSPNSRLLIAQIPLG